jgi:hypothetical protein
MSSSSVLKDVVVVCLDVHIWSGRKKLRPEDLTASGKLPPKELVSLGSKKIFDPKALKAFREVKHEAENLCLAHGVRFAKSYAIPRANVKVVFDELGALETKFAEARKDFLVTYDEEKQCWAKQYPGYEKLIETELLPKSAVEAKLSFGYTPFCINDVDDELSQALANSGNGPIVVGLSAQLFLEVAMQARDLIKRSLLGRNEVTQKFLRPVRAIRGKLAGLAFLDGTVTPLVETIDTVLGQLPARGKITGVPLQALRGVLSLLTDVNKMRQHAQLLLSGDPNGLAFDSNDERSARTDAAVAEADADGDGDADAAAPAGGDTVSNAGVTSPPPSSGEQNPLFF